MPTGSTKSKRHPLSSHTLGRPWICGKCGRHTVPTDEQSQWWLEGTSPSGYPVVRCPQHITDWAMRQVGKSRTMASYRWRREGKEHDARQQLQDSFVYDPFFDPNDLE